MHIVGRSEEGSSGSGAGPKRRCWQGHKQNLPELGCHCRILWEDDVEVPSQSGEVGYQWRDCVVVSESGGILEAPDSW